METLSLLQSFALNKNNELISINDVERGLACECFCPSCHTPVIARQGEIREWHFAHTSGTDCPGAAETALHLAAKKIIETAGGIMLPAISIDRHHRLPDGRTGRGTAVLPATWVDYDSILLEQTIGSIIPDVIGNAGHEQHIIEIGVTHFVDAEKLTQIQQLNLTAIEIDLSCFERTGWDWNSLEAAVVQSVDNKTWLNCPQIALLEKQAIEKALLEAINQPLTNTNQANKSKRSRFIVTGKIVDLIEHPFGIALWSPYDHQLNEVIKSWSRAYGGNYQPKFKNWLFPTPAKSFLLNEIKPLGGTQKIF